MDERMEYYLLESKREREGFVFNVRGNIFTDMNRFIKNYAVITGDDTEVLVIDEDIKKEISVESTLLPDCTIYVTRDLLKALNHVDFVGKTDIVLVVCDKPVSKEQLDRIENIIRVYAIKFALKIVFFTQLLDETFSDFKNVDSMFSWEESENDFVKIERIDGIKVNLSIDDMMQCIKHRMKEIVEDVNKIVNNELVRSLILKKWNAINDHKTGDKEKVEKEDV